MSLPPEQRGRHLALTLALAALVAALLVLANRHYLFQSEQYEADDLAANSLSILRAEHFGQLYGQYSRWGFRHPGPAMFCALAAGEKVFYQWLHLVPTPLNAQVLAALGLFSCFLAASVSIAARRVRSGFFLPLAVLAATLHFTAVDTRDCLTSCWPPFEMVMPFILLLVAAASVMAGQGADLPLLALAGCFLIHLHVAQPLFVLPMFALAYAGLAWSCGGRPWREYRREHAWAAGVAAVFVLPMIVDLCRGSRSNFALILDHLHTHSGEPRHPWLDSVYYFLRFGVYKPSLGEYIFTHHADYPAVLHLWGAKIATTELWQFLGTHVRMAFIWMGAVLLPVAAGLWRVRRGPAQEETASAGRWRFLGCLGVVWGLSVGLTLVWGHVQDGEMFYFNAWFDYGIYFVLALIAVGAASDGLETLARAAQRPALWQAAAAAICLLGAVARVVSSSGRYTQGDHPENVLQAHTVLAAIAENPGARRPKLLLFPHDAWVSATAVATLLARQGLPFYVAADWRCMFGDEYGLDNLSTQLPRAADGTPAVDFWRLIPAAESPALAARRPLKDGNALFIGTSDLDPNPGASIDFAGEHVNADLYALTGWSSPRPGDTTVWSEGKQGVLAFHRLAVPEDSAVEITFDFEPNDSLGEGFAQRLGVRYNGADLGTRRMVIHRGMTPEPPRVLIPAAWWNQHPDALLDLDFPDTVSPMDQHINLDSRQLGFITRRITFRVVPSDAPPSP